MMYVMLFYLFVMTVVGGLLVAGRMSMFRGTPVESASRWIYSLPSVIGLMCCLVCSAGDRSAAERRFKTVNHYLTEGRNPMLQIFYLVLVLPAMYIYHTRCIPHFDSVMAVFSSGYCALGLWPFYQACYAPNGVVPGSGTGGGGATKKGNKKGDAEAERAKNNRFVHDGLLSHAQECRTCKVPRPPRSKHCRLCGHCVRRFDHHCAWLNCDVGEENLRWFHAFLIIHFTLCAYACYTCCDLLMFIRYRDRLDEAHFVNQETGQRHPATWDRQFFYLMRMYPSMFAVAFFTAIVSVMLFVFWLQHLKMALQNMTTNETYKVQDLVDYLESMNSLEKEWKLQVKKVKEENEAQRSNPDYKQQIVTEWEDVTKDEIMQYIPQYPNYTEPKKLEELLSEFNDMVNVKGMKMKKVRKEFSNRLLRTYRRGWLKDLKEVFFPFSPVGSEAGPTSNPKKETQQSQAAKKTVSKRKA